MKTIALVAISAVLAFPFPLRAEEENATANFHGNLVNMQMLDTKVGWATGSTEKAALVLRTEDGGKSWTDISPHPIQSGKPLLATEADSALTFQLQDGTHGWVACVPNINDEMGARMELFSTTDGGKHWQPSPFKTSVGDVTSIQFVDQEHGFIQVESDPASGHSLKAVYRTTNGGKTWQTASETSRDRETPGSLPRVGFSSGMTFRNAREGWASGSPRGDRTEFFFRTVDAGKTWRAQAFPWPEGMAVGYAEYGTPHFYGAGRNEGVMSVHFIHHDPEQGALVFYGTHDGGEHWRKTGAPEVGTTLISYSSRSFADADHGFLLIGGQLLATADRGATWSKVETNRSFGKKDETDEMEFVSPTEGWMLVGKYGDDPATELLRTVDGGHTWTRCFGAETGDAAR